MMSLRVKIREVEDEIKESATSDDEYSDDDCSDDEEDKWY